MSASWSTKLDKLMENLPNAVAAYLQFEYLCKRDSLFSEAYMAKPIGEYLISNKTLGSLVTEYNHPAFEKSETGRSQQLDFAFLRSGEEENPSFALETKWYWANRSSTLANGRILNDILRLRLLVGKCDNAKFYFLIGALKEDFDKFKKNEFYKSVLENEKKLIYIKDIIDTVYKRVKEQTKENINKSQITSFKIRKKIESTDNNICTVCLWEIAAR